MMKRKISNRELKQIRNSVEALSGTCGKDRVIQVCLALPEPCDAATREYAHSMILGLKKVNCVATISFIFSFSCHEVSDKPFEVLQQVPVATPCIRVYAQKDYSSSNAYGRLKKSLRTLGKWLRPNTNLNSVTIM